MVKEAPVKVGDRIELISMDDFDPLPPGEKGTVTHYDPYVQIIYVDWDNGRTLNVALPDDKFKIIS